jgi:hypothetical protein
MMKIEDNIRDLTVFLLTSELGVFFDICTTRIALERGFKEINWLGNNFILEIAWMFVLPLIMYLITIKLSGDYNRKSFNFRLGLFLIGMMSLMPTFCAIRNLIVIGVI